MTDDSQISSPPAQQQSEPAKRRRRRRWPYYLFVLLIVLPLLSYALMPWLIPTGWVRDRIVEAIEEQFGRSASIAAMEISWAEGITVYDITIERMDQFGPGHFFKAARMQLNFNPLRLLLDRQIGTVRVDQPQLWIVADPAGKVNLTSLPQPRGEPASFELIAITNANLIFVDRIHQRESLLAIPKINIARDQETGQFSFLAQSDSAGAPGQAGFSLEIKFTPPQSQPVGQEPTVAGYAELIWSDLDLAQAPLPRLSRLDFQAASGKTSGQARLELYSDARIELVNGTASIDNLHLELVESSGGSGTDRAIAQPMEISITRTRMDLHGSYEFVSGQLAVDSLKSSIVGLELQASLKGRLLWEDRTFLLSSASLAATVQPARLQKQLPFLERLIDQHNLTVTGSSDLNVDFKQTGRIDHLSILVNARQTGLHIPGLLHKSSGLPCQLKLKAVIDHSTGLLSLAEPLHVELGSASFFLDMQLAQPLRMDSFLDLLTRPEQIARLAGGQWPRAQMAGRLQIEQIGDLAQIFPPLAGALSPEHFAGSAQGRFSLHPWAQGKAPPKDQAQPSSTSAQSLGATAWSKLQAQITVADQATLYLAPYFRKPAGESLTVQLEAKINGHSRRLEQFKFSCKLGRAGLVIENDFLVLGTVLDSAYAVGTAGQFRIENFTVLTEALPWLERWGLSGDLSGRYDLAFDPLRELRLTLALDADPFGCRVPGPADNTPGADWRAPIWFAKSASSPGKLDLHFWADLRSNKARRLGLMHLSKLSDINLGSAPYQARIDWTLGGSGGSLQVDHNHDPGKPPSDFSDGPVKSGFHFDLKLARLDLDSLAENLPVLSRSLRDYQLGGRASMAVSGKLTADLLMERLSFWADLTEARCIVGVSEASKGVGGWPAILRKLPGIPLSLRAQLSGQVAPGQGYRTVAIDSAELKLGSSRFTLTGSSLLATEPKEQSSESASLKSSPKGSFQTLEYLSGAQLEGRGEMVFDDQLFALLPALADLDRRIGLAGSLNYQLGLVGQSGEVLVRAELDSGSDGLKIGPVRLKKLKHSLRLSFDPLTHRLVPFGGSLDLDSLELQALEKALRVSGRLSLSDGLLQVRQLSVNLGDFSAQLTGRLENIWTAPSGYVQLYSPLIDQPDLADWANRLSVALQKQGVESSSANVTQTTASQLTASQAVSGDMGVDSSATVVGQVSSAQRPVPGEESPGLVRLPPLDINLVLHCERLLIQDPSGPMKYDLRQIDLDARLNSSSLTMDFTTSLNGGRVGSSLDISFDQPGLPLVYRTEALDLIADENTAPLVSKVFPYMTVTGSISESRSITSEVQRQKGSNEFPSEHGRSTLRDGVLVGPAAPLWVTYWFPKLSLTEYSFLIADNIFSRNPEDGSMTNDMVFVGKGRYNIYITGITKADNTTDYTTGVDLSPGMTLEQRHNWRQFRVPLVTYSGQIVDGQWARQTVSFTWPTRAAWDIFIKNNALRTLIERRRQAP